VIRAVLWTTKIPGFYYPFFEPSIQFFAGYSTAAWEYAAMAPLYTLQSGNCVDSSSKFDKIGEFLLTMKLGAQRISVYERTGKYSNAVAITVHFPSTTLLP